MRDGARSARSWHGPCSSASSEGAR